MSSDRQFLLSPYYRYVATDSVEKLKQIVQTKEHEQQLQTEKDKTGLSFLHIAAITNSSKVLTFLLDLNHKQDINVTNNNNLTPLHYAMANNNSKIVEILLINEANYHIKSKRFIKLLDIEENIPKNVNEKSILSWNYLNPTRDIDGNLIESPTKSTHEGITPLHQGIFSNSLESVEVLLSYIYNNSNCTNTITTVINMKDTNGKTPLHYAMDFTLHHGYGINSCSGNTDIDDDEEELFTKNFTNRPNNKSLINFNLMSRIDSDLAITNNDTIYDSAQRRIGIIKLLLNTVGIEVNSYDNTGRTPLHCAINTINENINHSVSTNGSNSTNDCLEAIEMLIKAGADVNNEDRFGNTPLYEACYNENETVVLLLLKYHANTDCLSEMMMDWLEDLSEKKGGNNRK